MTPPDRAAAARFRADLEAVTGAAPSPARRLGVAVSGGGDSLALLLLAAAAYPGAVAAATVDHRLRPEAAGEAAVVGAICARLGVPHAVLRRPDEHALAGNLQDGARRLRYALLARWADGGTRPGAEAWRAGWVATGHQRDDLAEGFVMRARRGAGVRGLAAMRRSRPLGEDGAVLVRPLLGWTRAELAAIVGAAGLVPAADPSNVDPRFERSRVRALLAGEGDLPAAGLALAAGNLRDAEEALGWATAREWPARHAVEADGTVLLDVAGLPREIRRRLAARALELVLPATGSDPIRRAGALDRLVRLLEAGRPATLAGVWARPGPRWRFGLAPPRRGA